MKVKDFYREALDHRYRALKLMIHFLVFEKKVLTMEDDEEKLRYFLQDKFRAKMNQHLIEYSKKVKW